jgi:hypothetical protein
MEGGRKEGTRHPFSISFIIFSGWFTSSTFKMEIGRSSKILVATYQTTRCHSPEDCNLNVAM